MDFIEYLNGVISLLFDTLGVFAPILACLLIIIESILPLLPLAVFITINFYYMGSLVGFIISWLFTCVGCYISYKLCKKKLRSHFMYMLDKRESKKLKSLMGKINNVPLEELVILIAIPFTPAFLINIASGLANVNKKKFITAILIGKVFLVYFWGFVGTSLLESIKEPKVLIKIGIMVILAFILSKCVNKKYNID